MINKVERLTSIGKFRDYHTVGPVNFKKLTLIFGDNGGGKTTLTAVFRSLTSDNPEIIRSRISTNHVAPQAAQISQTGTPNIFHTFGRTGWSIPFPDIEIFDIHFINENVYSGFDFSDEHKKQLHQFVIGAQGVTIKNQMEQNKSAKTTIRQDMADIEQQIIQQVGNNLSNDLITSFISIQTVATNGIDQQIVKAEAALASANAHTIIQTLQPLSPLSQLITQTNYTSLIDDLSATSQSIQNAVLETIFSDHCKDLSDNSVDSPETWLRKGFSYVENKISLKVGTITCPFCKQTLDSNADILKAYISKFDTEFNSLVQRLSAHLDVLINFNLEMIIENINNIIQTNNYRITSWTTHLHDTVQPPNIDIITNEADLKLEFSNLISLLKQKIQNPTLAVSTKLATDFQSSIQAINNNIDSYNQVIVNYNEGISSFRASIQSVYNAQQEVDKLKRIKMRFETSINTLCSRYTANKQTLRDLETAYTLLSQQQQAAATTFLTDYQARINHYLSNVFKTPFRIDNVIHVAPQGRAIQSKLSFKLTIDGKDISFNSNEPLNAKDCLSEGDKSTIALAFFLSKLDIDPNRHSKILIFDDPLSSLDTNRRSYTIGIIKTLFYQLKQVVVLSHNEYFLYEIGLEINASDKSTLKIKEDFAAKASSIEICDLDQLVKIEYFKQIESLEAFRSNPDLSQKDSVLSWLRNVIEAHLRFKFYKEIRSMTGQKTFGRLITFLDSYPVVFRDNTNRSAIILKLKLINGVSWKPHHGDPNPDYTILGINPNTITASELDNLIQDTLNLIEVQL